jgi:HlyD family secretion protein
MTRRNLLIALILLVLLGGASYLFYERQVSSASAAAISNLQTATVTRGTLVATVSGAGNIYAPQQTNLSFQLTGVPITKINVNVGDQVKAGQVLAQADDSDLRFALRSAQAQLTSAQANLSKLKQPPLAADVAAAQAAVASAQSAYNVAVTKSQHASDQIASAKAALDNAAAAVQQAQAAYDAIGGASNPRIGMTSQSLTLQQDTNNYQSALAAYNLALTDINDSSVKSAAQALSSAQDSLVKLTQPPTPQDLTVAQASVDSAQVAVDQAQRNLNQAKVIAPFDGTIAAVNYVVGQLSPAGSSTPVITLVNMNDLQTQITVSEVDIPKVKLGQQVDLSFDALGGQTFPGKITSVAPVGTVTQGVVNYTVTVALTKPDKQIMPGMTATASIVVAQDSNVLMVPNRAVQQRGNQKMLTVLFEGKQIPLFVQTGLNNDQSTEITGATSTDGQAVQLKDGDTVVLNPTTTTSGGNFRGGGGNFFFRGPGG